MAEPDASLPELVLRRLALSEQVAAAKFGAGRPVDDPVREQRELARVRVLARDIGLDPDLAAGVLADQIAASKQVQHRLFAHWTAHPGDRPVGGPDLSVLRAELDGLTVALLNPRRTEAPDAGAAALVSVDAGSNRRRHSRAPNAT